MVCLLVPFLVAVWKARSSSRRWTCWQKKNWTKAHLWCFYRGRMVSGIVLWRRDFYIWVERTEQSVLQELISALHSRTLVGLSLPMNDKGMLPVNAWETEPTFKSLLQSNGQAVRVYNPSPRLFIIGAVHIARSLGTHGSGGRVRGGGHRSPCHISGIRALVLCKASV